MTRTTTYRPHIRHIRLLMVVKLKAMSPSQLFGVHLLQAVGASGYSTVQEHEGTNSIIYIYLFIEMISSLTKLTRHSINTIRLITWFVFRYVALSLAVGNLAIDKFMRKIGCNFGIIGSN